MKAFDDQHILERCLLAIEEQLGWGKSVEWHNDVFNELSEKILEDTKVSLSPTTLKRVWGRIKYNGTPGISTLNTLAKFAGAENWRDYKIQAQAKERDSAGSLGGALDVQSSAETRVEAATQGLSGKEEIQEFASERQLPNKMTPQYSLSTMAFSSVGMLAIVFLGIMLIGGSSRRPSVLKAYPASFTCKPVTQGLPNSVVFDLDLGDLSSDSMYIQQYWDPSKTIKVGPGQKQATGIYYFPGYFRAKLLVDGEILQEEDLFIKSEGWMATLDYDPIPKYIERETFSQDVFLGLGPDALAEISQSAEPITSTFHHVGDLGGISGDDFVLNASIQNAYREKWAVCQSARVIIVGTKGAMIVPFSFEGCSSENNLMVNDIYLNGKKHDLSAFSVGLSEPLEINITNRNKVISFSANGKEIYSSEYYEPMGKVVGIRYKFLGAGEVHYSRLEAVEQ